MNHGEPWKKVPRRRSPDSDLTNSFNTETKFQRSLKNIVFCAGYRENDQPAKLHIREISLAFETLYFCSCNEHSHVRILIELCELRIIRFYFI